MINRKKFLKISFFSAIGLAISGTIFGKSRITGRSKLWQIDPNKCMQCGKCQTECVIDTSAVKTIHAYAICGYCDLCSGYFKKGAMRLTTGAEYHLCPTNAITRSFVEDPYYEYVIDESKCIACGKCVKNCSDFGNGSLFLQIKQELCKGCNRCSIASKCPANAISQVSRTTPYILKGGSNG